MITKGLLITVEGIEGTGKTTITRHLDAYLQAKGYPVFSTREPGGTVMAERIRQLLLGHHQESITVESELLLMFAARSQHIHHVIKPQLVAGNIVISDRFIDSSFAYQGGGRFVPNEVIERLQHWIQDDLTINLTLLLDASPQVIHQRLLPLENDLDRIEQENQDFFARVRATYKKRAHLEPQRFVLVDAEKRLDLVKKEVNQIVIDFLLNHGFEIGDG